MKLFTERHPRQDLWLIAGLGNPGKEYVSSRHNAGFRVADRWAERHRIAIDRKKPWALLGEGEVTIAAADAGDDRSGRAAGAAFKAIVAKPRTYMNLSGEALVELVNRYHADLRRTVVVYDDMDLPLGRVRVREKGSAGGHNGMANIINRLGTQEIPRIRVGIGRPVDVSPEVIDYVLGRFKPAEQDLVDKAIDRACDAIDCIIARGIATAMNIYNTDPGG